jgi:hypothetical protein
MRLSTSPLLALLMLPGALFAAETAKVAAWTASSRIQGGTGKSHIVSSVMDRLCAGARCHFSRSSE